MSRTAEVRWFFRGHAPAALADWFEKRSAEPREREDRYLRLPGTDALGVKLRGGEDYLELKLREHDHGEMELSDGIVGNVEQWRKWSFERTTDGPSSQGLGLLPHVWLPVHKTRRLVTYVSPDWKPSLEEIGQGEGCNVELTDLRAEREGWSTLGLEAFGSEDNIVESLWSAARALFGEFDLPQGLRADASCGYPGWLLQVAGPPTASSRSSPGP